MKRVLTSDRKRAFTLLELVLVFLTATVFFGLVLPILLNRPSGHQRINCLANLKQIGVAFRLYAADNDDKFPAQGVTKGFTNWGQTYLHFKAVGNELSSAKVLVCPDDKTRIPVADFSPTNFVSNSNLSYFIASDADQSKPNLLLIGDRHLDLPRTSPVLNLTSNMSIGWTKELHFYRGGATGGNVALVDGSGSVTTSKQLRAIVQAAGDAGQRIMLP
jgi:competence protein ComGC